MLFKNEFMNLADVLHAGSDVIIFGQMIFYFVSFFGF